MLSDKELQARLDQLSPEELAELDRLLLAIPPTFRDWLPHVTPTYRWDWPHLRLLQDKLQRVSDGTLKRLIISCPPRHGKTEQGTVRFPIYRLVQNPQTRVIIAAYNATLARKFSRKARRIARQVGVQMDEERKALEDWGTKDGGGIRAAGVGEGVTGQGADLILIDDPVKSREEAESEVYREKTYEWYTDDLYSRLEPRGAIVITMTRWHEDDLVGRILASEDRDSWEVVNLPALAEPGDVLGRKEGEALCPERYDEEALAAIQKVQTSYSFSALYQCRPTPRTGNMFPSDKVSIVEACPSFGKLIRYWDKAGTKDGGAYTAGIKMGFAQGKWWVLHVERFRLEAFERDQRMRLIADMDGLSCHQWVEQEPGSGGKESAQNFVRVMAGHSAHYEPVTGDKVTRADPWAAQWQAGNVCLLRGEWNAAYIREHGSFPNGTFKDQVDASAGAFQKLAKTPGAVPVVSLTQVSNWR